MPQVMLRREALLLLWLTIKMAILPVGSEGAGGLGLYTSNNAEQEAKSRRRRLTGCSLKKCDEGMTCYSRMDGQGVCRLEHPCASLDMFKQCRLRNEVCGISGENLAVCHVPAPCDLVNCASGYRCVDNGGIGQCHKIGSVCAKRTCATGKICEEVDGSATCTRMKDACSLAKTRLCESKDRICEINAQGSQSCVKRPNPCDKFKCDGFSRCEAVGTLVHCRPSKCNKVTVETLSQGKETTSSMTVADFCASEEGGNQVCALDGNKQPVCEKVNPCNNRWCPNGYFCSPNPGEGTSQCVLEDPCKRYLSPPGVPGYTMHSTCNAARRNCIVDSTNTPKCVENAAQVTSTSTSTSASTSKTTPTSTSTMSATISTQTSTATTVALMAARSTAAPIIPNGAVPNFCESAMHDLCASRGKVCIMNKLGLPGCRTHDSVAAEADGGDESANIDDSRVCKASEMDKICLRRDKVCIVSEGKPVCRKEKENQPEKGADAALTCSKIMIAKCNSKNKVCSIVEGGMQRCRAPTAPPPPALVGCAIKNMAKKCADRGKVCAVLKSGQPICRTIQTASTTALDTRCDGACWGTQTCRITLGGSPTCVDESDECVTTEAWEMCAKRGKSCKMGADSGFAECVKASPCEERTCDSGYMCEPGSKKQDTNCIPVDLCERGTPSMRASCGRKKQGCRVTQNGGTECVKVDPCSLHPCASNRRCQMVGPKNASVPVCVPDDVNTEEGDEAYIEKRPHIVMFLTDDQGYANVGFKNANISSPFIDKLVTEGVVLNRHYGASWCAPSRASLMSGRMPLRVDHKAMHPGIPLLPEVLSAAGYRTAQVGKWHIGKCAKDMTPYERGFSASYGNLGQVQHDLTAEKYCYITGCDAGIDLWDTAEPAYGKGNKGEYSSYVYSAYIRKFIKGHNASKPLFLYINPTQPHTPYVVPEEYSQPYLESGSSASFAIYNGMITAVDDIVGVTVQALKSKRMWKNTLFIYASDNGGLTCAADYEAGFATNYPLRGGKLSVLEGGVRSLAFISGGFVPKATRGSTRNGYVHLADWYPTIGRLAGAPQVSDPWGYAGAGIPAIDGFDVWNYLSGRDEESPRNEILVADYRGPGKVTRKAALIDGDLKFVSSNGLIKFGYVSCAGWTELDETGQASVADLSVCKKPPPGPDHVDDAELADELEEELEAEGTVGGDALHNPVCSSGNAEEDLDCSYGCLFNITADPGERYDISAQYPDLVQAMHDRVVNLQRGTSGLDVVRRKPEHTEQDCMQTSIKGAKTGYMQPFYEHTPFYIRRVDGTPGVPQREPASPEEHAEEGEGSTEEIDSNASDSSFGEPEPNSPEPEYKHGLYEDYHPLEENYNVEEPAPRPAMPREVFETYE